MIPRSRHLILDELAAINDDFAQDELAYLALTSKIELACRDKLSWRLHRRLGDDFLVAREWRRRDLAVLNRDGQPLLLLEAKAMYSFDAADTRRGRRFAEFVAEDISKAHKAGGGTAEVYALVFMTHPHVAIERGLWSAIKYAGQISGAVRRLAIGDAVRGEARLAFEPMLQRLGRVAEGSFGTGTAFGVQATIDWWLVGPCTGPAGTIASPPLTSD